MYLPGLSLWEFGTTANAEGKADEDYEKRTSNPQGHNVKLATFIFVTPQAWEKGDEWAIIKKAEGNWGDVKVYNAGKIVEWLSIAPAQGLWLAQEIGKAPNAGFESAEDFWEQWTTGNSFTLSPDVVTAGREQESAKLIEAVKGKPLMISVEAASREEAIAFTIASLQQLQPEQKENFLARTITVDTEQVLKTLTNNADQLLFITKMGSSGAFNLAVTKGHYVIEPIGPDEQSAASIIIKLPKLRREPFVQALINCGLKEDKARLFAKESGRNMTIFRRMAGFENTRPQWADMKFVREIIPAMLIGKWDGSKEADRQLVSHVANESYDNYIEKISKWIHQPSTPYFKLGEIWKISSPLDMWSLIGKAVTSPDLERFRQAFLTALQYYLPALQLLPTERFMAPMHGKESEYSPVIREGMAQSAILLAVYGDDFKVDIQDGGQSFVDHLIFKLFENADDQLWISLDDVMPLLAEASPLYFLEALESAATGDAPLIANVFVDINSAFSPTSYHTGLLWGLENLAWLPEMLTRVSLLLARLSEIDPGGRLNNRPVNSLSAILLPWYPQTYATSEQQLTTLQTLASRHPAIAWNLFMKLLPEAHGGVAGENHKNRWRAYQFSKTGVTHQDLFDKYAKILDLCLHMAGIDIDKLVQLLDKSDNSRIDTDKILSYMKGNAKRIEDSEQKIWTVLRKTLSHHRSHPTAGWAIPEEGLAIYVELYDYFKPSSVTGLNSWLFKETWPALPEGNARFGAKAAEGIQKRRVKGLKEMYDEFGLEGIIDLLPELNPSVVGDTLAYLIDTEPEITQAVTLLMDDGEKAEAQKAFLARLYLIQGIESIKFLYGNIKQQTSDPAVLSAILAPLLLRDEIWTWLASEPDEVQQHYWEKAMPWFGELDDKYMAQAIERFVTAGRFRYAVDQMTLYAQQLPTGTLVNALTLAGTRPSIDGTIGDSYGISVLFEELDRRTELAEKQLADLEWLYLPILTQYGSGRPPKTLHKEITQIPESFVELLKWTYLADTPEQREIEATEGLQNTRLAESGFNLLQSWELVPGMDQEGHLDTTVLKAWIAEVRELAAQAGRLEVADMQIGNVLARYPRKNEEIWPPDEICEMIDTINTKSLRDNFDTAIFNGRGITIRGPYDGGGTRTRTCGKS